MAWLCSEGRLSEVLLILTWWQPEARFLRSGDNLWEPRTPIPHVGCGATNRKVHTSHLDSPVPCHKATSSTKHLPDQETGHGQRRRGCGKHRTETKTQLGSVAGSV